MGMQAAKLLSYSLESNKCCLAKICWELLIQKAQLEQKAIYQKQLKFSFACLMQAISPHKSTQQEIKMSKVLIQNKDSFVYLQCNENSKMLIQNKDSIVYLQCNENSKKLDANMCLLSRRK